MARRAPFCTAIAAALALVACDASPDTATQRPGNPALWEIAGRDGTVEGWMLGTIHALPDNFAWRTPLLDQRLAKADLLVVEVAGLADGKELTRQFQAKAFDRPTGPVMDRVSPANRARYSELLVAGGYAPTRFDAMESWAAALAVGQLAQDAEVDNGVDRALLDKFKGRTVVELEGAERQLGLFDALPEKEQRDLLNAVLDETASSDQDMGKLAEAWQAGDLDQLDRLTRRGLLADPELRQALLIDRNRDWATQVERLLAAAPRPFIAVGTGHLIGPEGLPALLNRRGYTVTRIQ